MSYETGTATSSANLLDRLNTFLNKGHSLTPQYTGNGTGRITNLIGGGTSPQETITITLTSSTAFSVTGGSSGFLGTGTVGTPFTSTPASFTITAGGTAWVSGDTISFVMTPPWQTKRSSAGLEYIWEAPDNNGAGSILVGAKRFFDVGLDYDNWMLGGFIAYDAGAAFVDQAGYVGAHGVTLPLWNQSIPYWFAASGRRVIVVAKVSTQFESAYLGFLNCYMSPGQYPYPLVVGGSMAWTNEPPLTSNQWRYSYAGIEHRAFPMSDYFSTTEGKMGQLRLRKPDGVWAGFRSAYYQPTPGAIWPYSGPGGNTTMSNLLPNLDGSYPTFPVIVSEDVGTSGVVTGNIYGELDGIRATTGHNNGAENTITDGRDVWLVVQNVAATTKRDYFLVRLD